MDSCNDIKYWMENNQSIRNMQHEAERESYFKSSDEVSNSETTNESKTDDTSSTKSSGEDEKRIQKHKKDILHRDIEKRRRDRINNSLAELRTLIPTAKTKIKCDGNTRTARLQKAKLLELTVDYFKSLARDKKQLDVNMHKDPKQIDKDAMVVESAHQIYLSAYKTGFNNAMKQICESLPAETQNISLDLNEIAVPSMFLNSEKKSNPENSLGTGNRKRKIGSSNQIYIPSITTAVDNEFSTSTFNKSSVIQKTSALDSCIVKENPKNETFSSNKQHNLDVPNDAIDKSIDSKTFSERSPILISSYVLNEDKTRYYPTILPLDIILQKQNYQTKDTGSKIYDCLPIQTSNSKLAFDGKTLIENKNENQTFFFGNNQNKNVLSNHELNYERMNRDLSFY